MKKMVLIILGILLLITTFALEESLGFKALTLILGIILLNVGRKYKSPEEKEKIKQEELLQQQKLEEKKQQEILEKSNNFLAKLDAIPKITINKKPITLERKRLRDMNELKFSNINKTFNPSSLLSFVVIDTETTGLKAQENYIIELSAILYEDFVPTQTWNSRIYCDKHIPEEASEINGIYDEDLVEAPNLDDIAESFLEFVDNSPVVGYNLGFDLKFLFCSGIDLLTPKRKIYDVLDLARKHYKNELDSFSLENVCKYNNLYYIPHSSLSDCYATAELLKIILEEKTNKKL